jgi:hypothetical protein
MGYGSVRMGKRVVKWMHEPFCVSTEGVVCEGIPAPRLGFQDVNPSSVYHLFFNTGLAILPRCFTCLDFFSLPFGWGASGEEQEGDTTVLLESMGGI